MPVRPRSSPTGSQQGLIPLVLMEPVERHQPSPPEYMLFLLSAGLSPVSGTLHHILPPLLKQGGRQGPALLWVFPRDYLAVPLTNSYLDSV